MRSFTSLTPKKASLCSKFTEDTRNLKRSKSFKDVPQSMRESLDSSRLFPQSLDVTENSCQVNNSMQPISTDKTENHQQVKEDDIQRIAMLSLTQSKSATASDGLLRMPMRNSNEEKDPGTEILAPTKKMTANQTSNFVFPQKYESNILSQGSGTDESEEEEIHEVWDDTEFELRGIDTERNLKPDGQRFDFFHWYKARYGSFPNKRAQITNKKVAEAIMRLNGGNRKVKDSKLTKPDYSDTTDYSKPCSIQTCPNMGKFVEFWRSRKRKQGDYLKTCSKEVIKEDMKIGFAHKQSTKLMVDKVKSYQFQNLPSDGELKPFLIPLEKPKSNKFNFKGRWQNIKKEKLALGSQFIEVVKRNEKPQKQVIQKDLIPLIETKNIYNSPLKSESLNVQFMRGELNHIRKSSVSSATLDTYRIPKSSIKKRQSHNIEALPLSEWIRTKDKPTQRWNLESILTENKPKVFRA